MEIPEEEVSTTSSGVVLYDGATGTVTRSVPEPEVSVLTPLLVSY